MTWWLYSSNIRAAEARGYAKAQNEDRFSPTRIIKH
ncbi:hypothetical protein [Achromobacter phage ewik_TL4]|nr:hypothetical protein [Achromobacter phage ewik_TL4]